MDRVAQSEPLRTDTDRLLIRVSTAARLLSISRSTAYQLARTGRLPGVVRLGRSIRVSVLGLEEWIDQERAAPTAGQARPGDAEQ